MLRTYFLFINILVLVLLSCDNNRNNSNGLGEQNEFSNYFGAEVQADFEGYILDINETPIIEARVTIGDQNTLTNSEGKFIITNATVNERFAYIRVEKNGYVNGSRTLVPTDGLNNNIKIILLDTNGFEIDSGSSETITLSNGASVTLNGNYIDESGNTYSGPLKVVIHHLDPTDENMIYQMPGVLYGENNLGIEQILKSYGMLAIELLTNTGQKINLADGETAQIKIPIDPSLISSAPIQIPLWYFDETFGYWKEEGLAILTDGYYIGDVSHFSFWNFDYPTDVVDFCFSVLDQDGNFLPNYLVTITPVSNNLAPTVTAFTNNDGEICGFIPANELLDINVFYFNDNCGQNNIYTETIGPFNDSASLSIISSITSSSTIIITGIANDCNGNPLTHGLAYLYDYYQDYGIPENRRTVIDNGVFEFTFDCSSIYSPIESLSLITIDLDNYTTSGLISHNVNSTFVDLGSSSTCNPIPEYFHFIHGANEYFTYQLNENDDSQIYPIVQARYDLYNTSLDYYPLEVLTNFWANYDTYYTPWLLGFFPGHPVQPTPGIYDNFILEDLDDAYYPQFTPEDITTEVTAFGEVGEYIDLNFYGTFMGENVSGIVHVIRRDY